jgi:hypothetical protein
LIPKFDPEVRSRSSIPKFDPEVDAVVDQQFNNRKQIDRLTE